MDTNLTNPTLARYNAIINLSHAEVYDCDKTVIIPMRILAEINYITYASPVEIGGLLEFEKAGDVFTCKKIVSMAGEGHSFASFSISAEKVAEYMLEIMEKGEEFHVNGWWHSHCDMSPFLSGVDLDMVEDILKHSDYVISVVANKKGRVKFFLNLSRDVTIPLTNIKIIGG